MAVDCVERKISMIETERLILRRYKKEDLQDLFEYVSDTKVVEYEPYKPLTLNETKENLNWRMETDEMIAIEMKHSHKMIGNVYMGKREFESLELGYVLNRNYWGFVFLLAKDIAKSKTNKFYVILLDVLQYLFF